MNSAYRLTALLMGTTVMVAQPFSNRAMAQVSVGKVAKDVTVFIQGVGSPDNFGSGVIIGRSGSTYKVLTAAHVVSSPDQYTIQTNDGVGYTLKSSQRFPGIDMAVVQFESSATYSIAPLGNSDQVEQTNGVYVAGFAKPGQNITVPVLQITNGDVSSIIPSGQARDGYGLAYTNPTRAGMSGGPVFNTAGEVVAIHGRKESESGGGATNGAWLNLGIPINRYKSGSQVAQTPDSGQQARQQELARQQQQAKQQELARQQQEKSRQQDLARQQALAKQQQQAQQQKQAQGSLLASVRPLDALIQPQTRRPTSTRQVCKDIRINTIVMKQCRSEAVASENESASRSGDAPENRVNSGNSRLASGSYGDAIAQYTLAIEGNSGLAVAYFNRGLAYFKSGERGRAIEDFTKAADLFEQQRDSQKLQQTQEILKALSQVNS
ncbi:MAG: tetratricopeptide repeat protein [Acaryochloridaceae cyanobacterium RU_4_10]|nr:tetratricopeptide repeat protein [Acaryochloridaceae cyanobacterium RU_4_10]